MSNLLRNIYSHLNNNRKIIISQAERFHIASLFFHFLIFIEPEYIIFIDILEYVKIFNLFIMNIRVCLWQYFLKNK